MPVEAQDAAAPVAVLSDDANDIEVQSPGVPTSVPAGVWDAMDLQALTVQETPLGFLFTLKVANLQTSPQDSVLAAVEYEIAFRHQDRMYKIRSFGGDTVRASLEALPPGVDVDKGYGDYVAAVPATPDLAAGTITFELSRDWIVDSEGAAPFPGRVLDLFMVEAGFLNDNDATVFNQPASLPALEDRMPNTGAGEVMVPVLFGLMQQGTLRLRSDEPFRASNGEASTFVFRVNATNIGERDAAATFALREVPPGWDVRVPDRLRLEANQSVEVPVIVRTAFSHAHGSTAAFILELASTDGASVGRIQIGLRYPAIAQPAGHHNTVYLHNLDASSDPVAMAVGLANRGLGGFDSTKRLYFNTAEGTEDPTDAQTSVRGYTCRSLRVLDDGDTVGTTYCWSATLSPGLEMGLDFDLAAEGQYSIPIHSLVPQPATRVQGTILHYAPVEATDDPFLQFFVEPTIVATLEVSDRVDIGLDGSHIFTGVIRATPEGDLLPYQKGASLVLQLEASTGRPDNFFLGPRTEPDVMPGAFLQLPLLEYEDPVDTTVGFADALHLTLDGEAQRLANPGDTVVYQLTLHNADVSSHELGIVLAGSNREWGQLLGRETVTVAAGGDHILTVAVTVPSEARDGDRADLVLEVASREDIAIRTLARLVTTADTDAEHEDQGRLLSTQAEPKGAPGLHGAVALLVALAAAALRREPPMGQRLDQNP